ncbi:MAG: PAS domain S-box protein [Proteobacteria bacterium]|nr:PAS domain S-box protein [Pseudomonadota bacterium]
MVKLLLDSTAEAIYGLDTDGNCTFCNAACLRMLGYEQPEQLLGRNIHELIHHTHGDGTSSEVGECLIAAALRQGEEIHADDEVLWRADGTSFASEYWAHPVRRDGKIIGSVVTFLDITERKRMEEAQNFIFQCGLRYAGEDFFESLAMFLAQSLDMDYVCIDSLHGDGLNAQTVAIYYDGKFEDNVQYALKDTPCGDVVGNTICCFQQGVRNLFPQDTALQEMLAESYVGTTLWSFDGKPIGLIAVIGRQTLKDPRQAEAVLKLVSVRAAGELERKQAEKKLQDKNRELERFTYTVSHDLKSPLITIQSYAGMIRQDMETGNHERAKGDIKRIEDAAEKMTNLLNDLLELSRIGKQMNPTSLVDMRLLVTNVLSQLVGPLKQRLVEVVVQPDLPAVYGDHRRIAEALQNLVENAVKYMGDQPVPRVEIGCRQNDTEVVFFVGDNGQGIDLRHHEDIFGLFNKLDAKSEGTGVGLTLVKRIIELHGGRVWVESEGGGMGSRFCFTLPLHA